MEKYGFKVLRKGLINRYGMQYEIGEVYTVSEPVKYGNFGTGFHFCGNPEDCFRYIDAKNEEVDLVYVRGFGEIVEHEDDYFGYYNLYAAEHMEILGVLTRKEIIEIMLARPKMQQIRFMRDFPLSAEEEKLFKDAEYDHEVLRFRY